MAWVDLRDSPRGAIYAQRPVDDGVVGVALALEGHDARPGLVTLRWFAVGAPSLAATVYRRQEAGAWTPLAGVRPDGSGHIVFEDRDVASGQRYAYRLGYDDAGAERFAGEVWVTVPWGAQLALEGLRPHPARGAAFAPFALREGPAVLEMMDLAGRRVLSRSVGSLGPGDHLLRLDETTGLSPGLYVLRLSQGGRSVTARAMIVR